MKKHFLALVAVIFFVAQTPAQTGPLQLKNDLQNTSVLDISLRVTAGKNFFAPNDFSEFAGRFLSKIPENERSKVMTGTAPGNILHSIERPDTNKNAFLITIDLDGDNSLLNNTASLLLPNTELKVQVKRNTVSRPYIVTYYRESARNGIVENITWKPDYMAEGILKTGACAANIYLFDLNVNGVFSYKDITNGSALALDRNGDAKLEGADEYLTGTGLFEFCDKTYYIDSIEDKGDIIRLRLSGSLTSLAIGDNVSHLRPLTLDGKEIRFDQNSDRIYVLDFWASWCTPCVNGIEPLRKNLSTYKDKVSLVLVNIDEPERLASAGKIIEKFGLQSNHIMNRQGTKDLFWKQLGGLLKTKASPYNIPYTIVIYKGKLIFAANGDEQAGYKNLNKAIETCLRKN
jgi:thiol-disulfide isomerase/thioredoxin